jgi:hypothetical protein
MDNIVLDEVKKIGVKLKYPTMNMSNLDLDGNKTQMDIATESIIHSIDYIYDEDNIYKKEDTSKAELVEFIDNLSQEQFTKLATFFETMPKLKHKIKWKCNKCRTGGYGKFFRLLMGHDNLLSYYKTNFNLMQHHKYSLSELENMFPFERDIYILLLSQHIEQENQKIAQQQSTSKGRR